MKRIVRNAILYAGRAAVLAACGLVSAFVLASGYESTYNRALPYVHTLDSVDLTAVRQVYDLPEYATTDPKMYGTYGKPVTLKTSGSQGAIRLDIAAPVYQHNAWLARATTLHALITEPPRKGDIGTLLLYCRASFRTIAAGNLPAAGSNVFVDTDQKWRYVYKVTSAHTYPQHDPYIPTSSAAPGKLLVVCNDHAAGLDNIIEADLLSVQGTDI